MRRVVLQALLLSLVVGQEVWGSKDLSEETLALMKQETGGVAAPETDPKAGGITLKFADVEYVHRWSQDDQHEFTPHGQEDLARWSDMVTVGYSRSVTDGESLAAMVNAVLENYRGHGAMVLKIDSVPRTKERPAEHLVVVLFPKPDFIEAAFARFKLERGIGSTVVYSHRVYGNKVGDQMSAWLEKTGPLTEKALMSLEQIPLLAARAVESESSLIEEADWPPGENLLTSFIPTAAEWEALEKKEGGSYIRLWQRKGSGFNDSYSISVFRGLKQISELRKVADSPGKKHCKTFESEVLDESPTNGYSRLMWRTRCRREDRFAASILQVAIQGRDSLYHVQKIWRTEVSDQEVALWRERLASTSVCDTRVQERPCPEGFERVHQ